MNSRWIVSLISDMRTAALKVSTLRLTPGSSGVLVVRLARAAKLNAVSSLYEIKWGVCEVMGESEIMWGVCEVMGESEIMWECFC